jgi:hypothetical protein
MSPPQGIDFPVDEVLYPGQHRPCCLVGKRGEQYRGGRDPQLNETGNPVGQRSRLAAACAGNDKQRTFILHYYTALLGI